MVSKLLGTLTALVLMATPALASLGPPQPMPEPGSMTLMVAGLAAAAMLVRLRTRK